MELKINEDEREEIDAALGQRLEWLEKRKKDAEKGGVHDVVSIYVGLIALYNDGAGGGLKTMFSAQVEMEHAIDRKRAAAGEARDPLNQQDMFGGGAATGGGHPVGEVVEGVGRLPNVVTTGDGGDTGDVADVVAGVPLVLRWSELAPAHVSRFANAGPFTWHATDAETDAGAATDDDAYEVRAAADHITDAARLDAARAIAASVGRFAEFPQAEQCAAWLNVLSFAGHFDAFPALSIDDAAAEMTADDVTEFSAGTGFRYFAGTSESGANLNAVYAHASDAESDATEVVRDALPGWDVARATAAALNRAELAGSVVAEVLAASTSIPATDGEPIAAPGDLPGDVAADVDNVSAFDAADAEHAAGDVPADAWDTGPASHRHPVASAPDTTGAASPDDAFGFGV